MKKTLVFAYLLIWTLPIIIFALVHKPQTSQRPITGNCSSPYIAARNKVDSEYKVMVDELLALNDPRVGGVLHPHLRNVAEGLTVADHMERNGCKQ